MTAKEIMDMPRIQREAMLSERRAEAQEDWDLAMEDLFEVLENVSIDNKAKAYDAAGHIFGRRSKL